MPVTFAPHRKLLLILVGSAFLLVLTAIPGTANPGTLDPTFDADGRVTTDFGARDSAGDVAIQSDGKIVAAGFGMGPGEFDFAVARYNNFDGSLDTSFAGDGTVTTDFNTSDDRGWAVAIQSDGKIVVAGQTFVARSVGGSDLDFALVRYNSDGSLDTGFSGDGKVNVDLGGTETDAALDVAIQSDGKIVAAGYVRNLFPDPLGPSDFAVARFNADGTADTGFGVGGKITTDFATDHDEASAVAIQSDGRIVAAGPAFSGTFDFGLARYNTNGTPDTNWGGDGTVLTNLGGTDSATGLAIQPDQMIVAVGSTTQSGGVDTALARYTTTGGLDPGFDGNGTATIDYGGADDFASDVALQTDGKIVTAGSRLIGTYDFAVSRFLSNGSPDTQWSGDGKVTTDFGGASDIGHGVAIQSDGKIVVAGCAFCLEAYDFALARYKICRTTSRRTSIPC
jgi:uncharacterized delta-60 repeat protein